MIPYTPVEYSQLNTNNFEKLAARLASRERVDLTRVVLVSSIPSNRRVGLKDVLKVY